MRKDASGPFQFAHLADRGGTTNAVMAASQVPATECERCGERWIEINLAMPSLRVPSGLDRRLLRGGRTTVRLGEFREIEQRFLAENPEATGLIPGTQVGPITFRIQGTLRDVLWAGVTPFFSERVTQAAMARGVRLRCAPVTVTKRGRRVQDYYCCEPALAPLTSRKYLERFYDRCSACGQWKQKRGIRFIDILRAPTQFIQDNWPAEEGIVHCSTFGGRYFSDAFVELCGSGGFTGLGFARTGEWVWSGA